MVSYKSTPNSATWSASWPKSMVARQLAPRFHARRANDEVSLTRVNLPSPDNNSFGNRPAVESQIKTHTAVAGHGEDKTVSVTFGLEVKGVTTASWPHPVPHLKLCWLHIDDASGDTGNSAPEAMPSPGSRRTQSPIPPWPLPHPKRRRRCRSKASRAPNPTAFRQQNRPRFRGWRQPARHLGPRCCHVGRGGSRRRLGTRRRRSAGSAPRPSTTALPTVPVGFSGRGVDHTSGGQLQQNQQQSSMLQTPRYLHRRQGIAQPSSGAKCRVLWLHQQSSNSAATSRQKIVSKAHAGRPALQWAALRPKTARPRPAMPEACR